MSTVRSITFSRGFTLVELLIVIAIAVTVTSLIAPSSIKLVDQARSSEELLKLSRVVNSLPFQAYAKGVPITVTARGQSFRWESARIGQEEMLFEHLQFAADYSFVVDTNGSSTVKQIEIRQRGRVRIVPIGQGAP
jgi:prepilin-type N-terminal cleavage/methylation domain-containing protein